MQAELKSKLIDENNEQIEWFVVHTHAQKELLAIDNLERQGFSTYMPKYRKLKRHARKVSTVLAPLFPRYLFVAMNIDSTNWLKINSTFGVSYILCSGNQMLPTPIPTGIITELQQQQDNEGVVSLDVLELFHSGDKVRILEGPFKEQTAIYNKMSDLERAELLINLMQQQVKVNIPLHSIEKAY